MQKAYIDQHQDGYWVSGARVSLDSVVHEFLKGYAPESIAKSFPVLTLEQVYGAITYYLGRREEVDIYLARESAQFEEMRRRSRQSNPLLYEKLDACRPQSHGVT